MPDQMIPLGDAKQPIQIRLSQDTADKKDARALDSGLPTLDYFLSS